MNAQEEVLIKKFKRFLDDVKISKPEHLFQQEDKVIIHAIKTGFAITGFDKFYKEVLNG